MGGRERHAYLGISGQVIFSQLRNGNSKLEGLLGHTLWIYQRAQQWPSEV